MWSRNLLRINWRDAGNESELELIYGQKLITFQLIRLSIYELAIACTAISISNGVKVGLILSQCAREHIAAALTLDR